MSAGLLGAGLLLVWKGVKSAHTVQPGLMTGLGHHCLGGGTTGATGGDWIRATARGGAGTSIRLLDSHPLAG